MDVFRPPWYGGEEGGGEQLYILFQWMPHYQALGVKQTKKYNIRPQTHTHAYRLHIDLRVSHVCVCEFFLFFICVSCLKELTAQFKQTEVQKASRSRSADASARRTSGGRMYRNVFLSRFVTSNAPSASRNHRRNKTSCIKPLTTS